MAKRSDMLGVGIPPAHANIVGLSSVAITAAGTTTADATVCNTYDNVFTMTATGSDGIRLNTSTPLLQPIYISNTSASTGLVYPASGGNFNGGTTDASISVTTHKSLIVMRISATVFLSNFSA